MSLAKQDILGPDGLPFRSPVARVLARPAVYRLLVPGMTVANAAAGMVLPMLFDPVSFGTYALAVTLFQYGLIFDLGMSQLVDRLIPAHLGRGQGQEAERIGQKLLWMRLYIAIGTFAVVVAALAGLAATENLPFPLWAGIFSALAGLFYMVALGPCCVWRARAEQRDYAVWVVTLSGGLVVARLGGVVLGGIMGCFLALAAWYGALAAILGRVMPLRRSEHPSAREALSFVAIGIPLFATSFLWAFYLTFNRWLVAGLDAPETFGGFAFGCNLLTLLVGAASGLSAFYYPRVVARLAKGGSQLSREVAADCGRLTAAAALVALVGIVLTPWGLELVYPHFLHSADQVRVLLVAMPPLVLCSWLMPLSLSAGTRPWIDGVVIYPLALAALAAAILQLHGQYGLIGAAWASPLAALPLVGMQIAALVQARVLRPLDGGGLFAVALASVAGLALVVPS